MHLQTEPQVITNHLRPGQFLQSRKSDTESQKNKMYVRRYRRTFGDVALNYTISFFYKR